MFISDYVIAQSASQCIMAFCTAISYKIHKLVVRVCKESDFLPFIWSSFIGARTGAMVNGCTKGIISVLMGPSCLLTLSGVLAVKRAVCDATRRQEMETVMSFASGEGVVAAGVQHLDDYHCSTLYVEW